MTLAEAHGFLYATPVDYGSSQRRPIYEPTEAEKTDAIRKLDQSKLRWLADDLSDMTMPAVGSVAGSKAIAEIYEEINVLAESIRTRAAAL